MSGNLCEGQPIASGWWRLNQTAMFRVRVAADKVVHLDDLNLGGQGCQEGRCERYAI